MCFVFYAEIFVSLPVLLSAADVKNSHDIRVSRSSTIISIQYLRALAAILVVYFHVFSSKPVEGRGYFELIGSFGVDIFFVISGFIMWISTSHQIGGVWKFVIRRAMRIYPMWWIALTVWIVTRVMVSSHTQSSDVTLLPVVFSYLLIPHYYSSSSGHIWPILVPGWTLQIELVFYQIFAVALFVGRRLLRFGLVSMLVISTSIFGLWYQFKSPILSTYTSPLLLEFGFGVLIATLSSRIRSDRPWTGVALIAIAIILLGLSYPVAQEHPWRWLSLGVPASLIVFGGLLLEARLSLKPNKLLLLIGDSSYSLYLTHPITVGAIALVWDRMHFPTGQRWITLFFVLIAIVASTLVAIVVYKVVERPLLRKLIHCSRKVTQPKIAL